MATWAYAGQGGLGLGASGAVSALMGMYAVLYRMRRIRFFYQFLVYFNYVTAPALLLLPAWIANELLQHWLGGRGIAYMAHLGGLLTGGATTTMEVIDDPAMTRAGLLQLLRARDERNGWATILGEDALADHLDSELTELLQIAEAGPVGTVLEKRGPVMQTRSQVPMGGAE